MPLLADQFEHVLRGYDAAARLTWTAKETKAGLQASWTLNQSTRAANQSTGCTKTPIFYTTCQSYNYHVRHLRLVHVGHI